jgi:sec-independent protein translocase protein TatB
MFHGGDGFELLFLAAIAFVVVGPKDFPILLRKFGQFMGKMRNMAAEFRASFDEMARQSELDELRKEVDAMRQTQLADQAARETGHAEVSQVFNELGESLRDVQFHPPMAHQYVGVMTEAASEPASEAAPMAVAEAPKPRAPRRAKTAEAPAKPVAKRAAPAKSAAPAAKAARSTKPKVEAAKPAVRKTRARSAT